MLKKSGGLSARLLKRKRTAKRIYPMGPSQSFHLLIITTVM